MKIDKRLALRRMAAAGILATLAGLAAWSYAGGGIVFLLAQGDASGAEKIAALRAYFAAWGRLAPVIYMLLVVVEVIVAPIPGAMLYAPGGVLFGGLVGGTMSLLGNVLGAGIAWALMRGLGRGWVGDAEQGGKLAKLQMLLRNHGLWVVFLLRVNPLTSSDLVSYAAGLTPIPVWKVMAGTALGMAPLCYAQAYLADELLQAIPQLLVPLFVLCAIYAVVTVWVLLKFGRGTAGTGKAT